MRAQQPFKEYGYETKIATLSGGKYLEFFDQDSLVQIGSTILNVNTGKLVYFVATDTVYSEATLQPDVVSRWLSPDPLSEKFYSLSPYNSFANNPLTFTDPDGREIVFSIWNGEKWESKKFSELNKNYQKAIEAFAKTKEGNAFLSQFAKAGDKIGSVKFAKDGEHAEHKLEFGQFSEGNAPADSWGSKQAGKDLAHIRISVNTTDGEQEATDSRMAVAIGHEAFLHIDQYKDKLINAIEDKDAKAMDQYIKDRRAVRDDRNGGPEHDAYLNGKGGAGRMREYSTQLISIYNPSEVQKQMKRHDSTLKNDKKRTP